MSGSEQPKIIIDSDWKSQAQAEKERLNEKVEAKAAAKQAAQEAPIGFQDLLGLIASQAMAYLGYFPDPRTGQAMVSLEYARLHIDLLAVLEEKTKGNLSAEETEVMTKTLAQLRSDFVDVSGAVMQMAKEGKLKSAGTGAMASGSAPGAAPTAKPSGSGLIIPG